MSKCVNDGFTDEAYNNTDSCECKPFEKGSITLTIEEQKEDGTPNTISQTRYVKVCGSTEDCRTYPIVIDAETGMGTLELTDIASVQNVLVLVDETDTQIVNGDSYEVGYYLNEEKVEEDYVRIIFSSEGQEHHDVHIVNRILDLTSLEICKVLRDEFGNVLPLKEGMSFSLCLEGRGMTKEIVLNAENDFHVIVDDLDTGTYRLQEMNSCGYQTFYSFNGQEETTLSYIDVKPGANELQMINQRNSDSILTVQKFIRERSGELIRPQKEECFQFRIISDRYDQIYTLSCENDFAVDIEGLQPGFYDITEVGVDNYDTTYLVNGAREMDYAHVEIRKCEASSVMMINSPIQGNCECSSSPIRICKYVRGKDGCLRKPNDNDSFKVMLCGCGIYQTFNLNVCNNFCVDIEHICCGEYEIKEIDNECYETSYIVNDGCEKTSAFVCVHENDTNCILVINEEKNKGSVCVCKYKKDKYGNLVKPQANERFVATLRSFCFKETFILDESNDWCMYFDNLKEGSYEVRERYVDGCDTTYIVNGCKEQRHGRFLVDNDQTNEIRIVNSKKQNDCGVLKICKYIEKVNGDLVKPDSDEEFQVMVQGECFEETFRLHSKNNWCILLEGLKPQSYLVTECESAYHATYQVDGCEVEKANVVMFDENVEVTIINHEQLGGTLQICAGIRDCDGCMSKPRGMASFEILVEGNKESRSYTLDQRNRWCILLDDIKDGTYRITQKDTYGYEVTYEVDGSESSRGKVEMHGQDAVVNIINSMTNCQGMVKLRKFILDENGRRRKPYPQDRFQFQLKGNCFKKDILLDQYNDFCVFFDDLKEGRYTIEEMHSDYEARYEINGVEAEQGTFVLGRDDICIDIINEMRPKPTLCIQKRIRKDGCLIKPEQNECYEFVLKGKNLHEVYQLNASNDWMVCLCELRQQHYEVKELHCEGNVSYLIDDSLQADGYFLFDQEDKNITIINEEPCEDCVRISKCVEQDGITGHPYRWESFDILVEGRNYKQSFCLNCDNDWSIELCDLKAGSYEVKELGDYKNSFIINGCDNENGCFYVGQGDQEITIVNHTCDTGAFQINAFIECRDERQKPSEDDRFDFTLCHHGIKEQYTLEACNDWCLKFDDAQYGEYVILSEDKDVHFDVAGDLMSKARFVLDDTFVRIALLKKSCPNEFDLHIRKRMKDDNGCETAPMEGTFEVKVKSADKCECYTLDESNDWHLLLNDQPQGMIEVEEVNQDRVRYRINGGTLKKTAKFMLCEESEVMIINPQPTCGRVQIKAVIEDCSGCLKQPDAAEDFTVKIEGIQGSQSILLNQRNNWCRDIADLAKGAFEIQTDVRCYEKVTYQINGNTVSSPTFVYEGEDMTITLVFHEVCAQGNLEIIKYKKDSNCGCFVRPCMDESYEISVSGNNYQESFTLDKSNRWRKRLRHLAYGEYEVKERSGDFDVTYIVNGGKECASGIVQVEEDGAYVKVINAKHKEHTGSIEIRKYLQESCGLVKPDDDASFQILLKSGNMTKRFTLDRTNDFCVRAQALEKGEYEVLEEHAGKVSYVVNGECPEERGLVQVNQDFNTVEIINEKQESEGKLNLTKFIKQNGKLVTPSDGASYRIHVSRPGFNKVLTLNSDNDFQTSLSGLSNGWYVVDELDHDNVTYRIDGGSEVDCGVVKIQNDDRDIWVVNGEEAQGGSITLTKYLRQNRQLKKPQPGTQYRFHVSKAGFNEVYTLDESNDWTKTIKGLEAGMYVIQELDETNDVSYIIDGGSETDSGVVNVNHDDHMVFIVNTPRMETGSIRVDKYIRRTDHTFVKPSGTFSVRVHISRPGFNREFTLNSANDWSYTLSNLENGQYVLNEVDAQGDVSYVVNGGSEIHNGIVRVQDNANIVQMINTEQPSTGGSISIAKYVRSKNGVVEKPSGNFSARVHVSRSGYNEVFTLNQANNWTITIKNLMPGMYVINEPDYEDRVSYVINGGNETAHGIVNVNNNENAVIMINDIEPQQNVLRITKFIRNEAGQLVLPQDQETFQVRLISAQKTTRIQLSRENGWKAEFKNIPNGSYEVIEDSSDYHVSYIVNDGQEEANARFVMQDDEQMINIINSKAAQTNRLEITKYVRDEYGALIRPAEGDMFNISIRSNDYYETYELNSSNNFSVILTSLPNGNYAVSETTDNNYTTTYRINGGQEMDRAVVYMVDHQTNVVEVINERSQDLNILEIFKYIMNENGNYVKPTADEVFKLEVTGNDVQKEFTLNEANRWHIVTQELVNGTYTLREKEGNGYRVQYLVNGGSPMDTAEFTVLPGANNIVEVINEKIIQRDGTIVMNKRFRNAQGGLDMPSADQSFEVRLYSHQGYDETFTLNALNSFEVQATELLRGIYYVEELGYEPYETTFIVNGGSETTNSRIDVLNDQLQQVTVVNTETAMYYQVEEDDNIKIVIE